MTISGRLLAVSVGVAVAVVPAAAVAQSFGSGAAALGYALGSRDRTRQEAYEDEQMRMLYRNALIQEGRAAQSEADLNEALSTTRSALHNTWLRAGFDEAHALAYAQAYHFADDDQAVWLSVQNESPQQVGTAIHEALEARNFQLADQLLLGALIEAQRRQPAATSSGG